MLERWFRLREAGTTVRREVLAGLVTFATLSYILFVQPAVLALPPCGMDPGGVLFATCVASAVACVLMAFWANLPVAQAPGMGANFFFVFTICGAMGFSWQEALAANLIAGLTFLVLARVGFRERVMSSIPTSLGAAIGAGIGFLIAVVGLRWSGLVVGDPVTYVRLGDLSAPVARLALIGLALTAVLLVRRVPGAILIGIVVTALVGALAWSWIGADGALVAFRGVVGAPPEPTAAFQLDFGGLFARRWTDILAVLVVLLVLDLFDTVGTLTALGRQAGLIRDGKLQRARGALAADAAGTSVGALLGTSTVTSYVESAAGIAAGGRTGLTALVVGACMLAALVLRPLVEAIGAGVVVPVAGNDVVFYPVIAPVLILIGALMMSAVAEIEWKDLGQAIPAFLTIVIMPLSLSITDGIAWGFIACSLLAVARGRARDVSWMVHGFALVFVARYVWAAG